MFCSQSFDSAAVKDDHVLTHFARETCVECHRDLLQIGNVLYTRHDSSTCIKQAVKTEEPADSFNTDTSTRNDNQYNSNNLQCVDAFSYDYASLWQNDDRSNIEQQSSFEDLSEFINHQNFIPDTQCNESVDQSISVALEQTIDSCEVKAEPIERIGELSSSFQNQTAEEQSEKKDETVENTENNSFNCKICGVKLASKSALRYHRCRTSDSAKTSQAYECDICGKTFRHKNNVSRHKRELHPPIKVNLESTLDGDNHLAKTTDGNANACDVCGKTFNHKSSVYRHKLRLHTPAEIIICNICGRRFDDHEAREAHREECALKIRLRYSTSFGEMECNYCQKKFRLDASLRRHIRIKHNSNVDKFPCPLCPAIFMKESSLQAHICPKSVEHPCDICGQKLSTPRTLQTHKIICHSPIGTLFCNRCGKLFSTEEQRDEHKLDCIMRDRIHQLKKNGEFECYICHKRIKSKGN